MFRFRRDRPVDDVVDLTERLEPFIGTLSANGSHPQESANGDPSAWLDELVERAATLMAVLPSRPRPGTIGELVCPHDPERAREVVDALLERGLVQQDDRGCLELVR